MLDVTTLVLVLVLVLAALVQGCGADPSTGSPRGERRVPDLSKFMNEPYQLRKHPRIHLNDRRIARLKADAATVEALKQAAAEEDVPGERGAVDRIASRVVCGALAYVATGEPELARAAARRMEYLTTLPFTGSQQHIGSRGVGMNHRGRIEGLALGFDWCYDALSASERERIGAFLKKALREIVVPWHTREVMEFGNFDIRPWSALMPAALAVGDMDDEGRELMHLAQKHWETTHGAAVALLPGGGWPEGEIYAAIITPPHVLTADAVSNATTNVNYFRTVPWYRGRMSYFMHASGPVIERGCWRYAAQGDAERNRGDFLDYEHVTQIVLMDNFPGSREAAEARYRLNELAEAGELLVSDRMNVGGSLVVKALFWDANQPARKPSGRSWYAPGTETTFVRSDWTPDAAWLMFQCGPRFSYHQHQDQGMFCIYRKGDLAVDSGVYDGGGVGSFNNNMGAWYTRAIAHNVILFHNPAERFNSYRSGQTVRNDGGQRTWLPVSNTAKALDFPKHFAAYDTGHVVAFEETSDYAYVAGDVTDAYNSTRYATPGNVPKLREWTRQIVFVFARGERTNDLIIVFDRTETTLAGFEKKWLLHCLKEPEVDGKATEVSPGETLYDGGRSVVTAGGGKLLVHTLLPEAHRIRKVGGVGVKDQWVYGTRIEPDTSAFEKENHGDWRLEVEPASAAKRDLFLHVLVPVGREETPGVESKLTGASSVEIVDGPRTVRIAFAASGSPGGSIEIDPGNRPGVRRTLKEATAWEPAPPAPEGLEMPRVTPPDPNRSVFLLKPHLDGYRGCSTATISREYAPFMLRPIRQSYPNIEVGGGKEEASAFIRFDLGGLPADRRPAAATLALSVLWTDETRPRTLTVHRLLKPLQFWQLSWNYRNTSGREKWGDGDTGSGPRPGIDFEEKPVATVRFRPVEGGRVDIDVLDAVTGWMRDPATNHGLLLRTEEEGRIAWFSRDWDPVDTRHPQLEVRLDPPETALPR